MRELLDSDRVNFLVWRYLLEGNYRETAAKFQKEWHIQEPHRHFDFASHVKTHALVSVLNKGLLYNSLERQYAESKRAAVAPSSTIATPAGTTTPATIQNTSIPSTVPSIVHSTETTPPTPYGVFGPLVRQPSLQQQLAQITQETPAQPSPQVDPSFTSSSTVIPATENAVTTTTTTTTTESITRHEEPTRTEDPYEDDDDETTIEDSDVEVASKKRTIHEEVVSGAQSLATPSSPFKKARLSYSHADAESPMQLDDHKEAYPSPHEGETSSPAPVVPVAVHTDGPEQATQVGTVANLNEHTIFLRLTEPMAVDVLNSSTASSALTSSRSAPAAAASPAPMVLRCEWSPRDVGVLAVGGTDSLARVWSIGSTEQARSQLTVCNGVVAGRPDEVDQPYLSLIDADMSNKTTVTSLAWNGDGSAVAVAAMSGSNACVNLWTRDGGRIHRIDVPEPPVVKIRWSVNNVSLLTISPEKRGTLITVFHFTVQSSWTHVVPGDYVTGSIDATWISDHEFLVCGANLVQVLACSHQGISIMRTYDTREGDRFSEVSYDGQCRLAATASEKGKLDLWDEHGNRRTIEAHRGPITALQWQPISQFAVHDARLIATASEDCTVCLWNARRPELPALATYTTDMSITAIAFRPDGASLAVATASQVLVWRVGEEGMQPFAQWSRLPHPGWRKREGKGKLMEAKKVDEGGEGITTYDGIPLKRENGGEDDQVMQDVHESNGGKEVLVNGHGKASGSDGVCNGVGSSMEEDGDASEEEFEQCLGWDASGRKLMYGWNSRLAIIDVPI